MKLNNLFFILSMVTLFLTGCAVSNDKTKFRGAGLTYNADISTDKNGNYVAAVEAAPLAGRKGGAEAYALQNTNKHCNHQNKTVQVIKNETKSHLLVNGVARLTFKCV